MLVLEKYKKKGLIWKI